MQARTEVPALSIVPVPKALTVGADYGMIVLKGTSPSAGALAAFILSDAG